MHASSLEILVAEDNDDDVVLIREAFGQGRLDHRIVVVPDGEEALAYLKAEGEYRHVSLPSILLLDINMPKKNGFEVLAAIKSDPRLRALPVIMLTVSDREEDIIRSYDQGACSYIRKPVSLSRFVAVVKEFEIYWSLVSSIPPLARRRDERPAHRR